METNEVVKQMNRREMMKATAGVVLGGPAALEVIQKSEALALYRPLPYDFYSPLVINCRTMWPGYRMTKTNPGAVELARSMCR